MHPEPPSDPPRASRRLVHVLTVSDSLGFLRGQPEFMAARGYRMAVITSGGPGLEAFGVRTGVMVRGVTMHRRIAPLEDLRSLYEMVQTLRELRPDIVHAHTPKGGLLGVLGATLLGVPKRVYHLRGLPLETTTGPRRQLLKAVERLVCALATDIICVSPSLRQRIIEEQITAPGKLRVLGKGSGQGVNSEHFCPPTDEARTSRRAALGLLEDDVVFLFVGRLVGDKGIEELGVAWRSVVAEIDGARLLIAGKPEVRDGLSPAIVERFQNDPTVTRLGFLEDTRTAYAAADVVILPSRREGFPNVPLEAAAMGLPVITSDATGCVDSVEADVTGLVVPVGLAEPLAEAMVRYGLDSALRAEHGAAGRARVVRDFQPAAIWEGIAGVYASP